MEGFSQELKGRLFVEILLKMVSFLIIVLSIEVPIEIRSQSQLL